MGTVYFDLHEQVMSSFAPKSLAIYIIIFESYCVITIQLKDTSHYHVHHLIIGKSMKKYIVGEKV